MQKAEVCQQDRTAEFKTSAQRCIRSEKLFMPDLSIHYLQMWQPDVANNAKKDERTTNEKGIPLCVLPEQRNAGKRPESQSEQIELIA